MLEWKKEADKRIDSIEESREYYTLKLNEISSRYDQVCKYVRNAIEQYYAAELRKRLETVNIEELNRFKDGIKIKTLVNAGYDTINKLRSVSSQRLSQIHGLGEDSIKKIQKMLKVLEDEASQDIVLRFDPDKRDEMHSSLLSYMYIMRHTDMIPVKADGIRRQVSEASYKSQLTSLKEEPKFFLRLFWDDERKAEYKLRIGVVEREIQRKLIAPVLELEKEYDSIKEKAKECWDDFIKDSAVYYTMVEQLCPTRKFVTGYSGYSIEKLPQESGLSQGENPQKEIPIAQEQDNDPIRLLMEKINDTPIDLSYMKTDLRQYQLFGTKYALSQKKVLIGDEMGLGKTIQAIAAIAHLREKGGMGFLVVCPLSIVVNWEREIKKHSWLEPVVIYGNPNQRLAKFREWDQSRKVGITTYESLSKLPFGKSGRLEILVVDEAHNVKNPNAIRTNMVRNLVNISEYVIYMTGTPLENRLDEMRFLISSVNPVLGRTLSHKILFSREYKELIAPVYLRRTREQVVKELPELVEIEDWLIMNKEEEVKYDNTLLGRNFMQVRRISWNVNPISRSTKAVKLKEICEEAKDDGRKVLIFSYFLDTIDIVSKMMETLCIGVITGATKVDERQNIIDRFTDAAAGSVLVCQVNTGGIGLNIQAASVVIFCEPQYKPSTEDQALSRAYRIGQARSVMVHRLLISNSIEELMMERLYRKKEIFNEYAEHSVMAKANLGESEEKVMMEFIEAEIQKRGLNGKSVSVEEISEPDSDAEPVEEEYLEEPSEDQIEVVLQKEDDQKDLDLDDIDRYKDNEKALLDNIDINQESFEKVGLSVSRTRIRFMKTVNGPGIVFFVQINAMDGVDIMTESLTIRVNVYDKKGNMIAMGEKEYYFSSFQGSDNVLVSVSAPYILSEAAKVGIYCDSIGY